jgi:hypothetical protein
MLYKPPFGARSSLSEGIVLLVTSEKQFERFFHCAAQQRLLSKFSCANVHFCYDREIVLFCRKTLSGLPSANQD